MLWVVSLKFYKSDVVATKMAEPPASRAAEGTLDFIREARRQVEEDNDDMFLGMGSITLLRPSRSGRDAVNRLSLSSEMQGSSPEGSHRAPLSSMALTELIVEREGSFFRSIFPRIGAGPRDENHRARQSNLPQTTHQSAPNQHISQLPPIQKH